MVRVRVGFTIDNTVRGSTCGRGSYRHVEYPYTYMCAYIQYARTYVRMYVCRRGVGWR